MKATLDPSTLVAIIDTREQYPLDLAPLQVQRGTLTTGDFSIRGLEHIIAIERKSLPDLLSCCGTERERFDREVQRLLAYQCRALVVEASWQDIERGEWRSQIKPAAVIGSLLGWIAAGLPVLMCDSHERCGRYVSRLLYTAARRRYSECRELMGLIKHRPRKAKDKSVLIGSFIPPDESEVSPWEG